MLLKPSDFGLVAIALIVVNFFEIFRDLGIGPALIHRKEERGVAADTVFYIFPAVALIFYAVSYFIAPAARRFAHNGHTGAAAATTDIPPVTCSGPAPFHRPGCGFISRVYLVDAERGTRRD